MNKRSISTMADVARVCGVSIQTVSAVVNDRPGISDETRLRVRAAMSELDYQPNQQARTLRGFKNPMVGVIIPSITNPYFPELVRGIEDVARRSGHGLFLCNDDYDGGKALEYFHFIRANNASGLIASPGLVARSIDGEIERQIHAFARRNVPVVFFGEEKPDLPVISIIVDAREAVHDAARHLLELGHRRIGLIAPPEGLLVARERVHDFSEAFAALGHPLDPARIVPGSFDIEAGGTGTEALMSMPDRPTAIIAANDLVAMGAIAALQARGLRVPDDVSVLGFDDIPFARVFQPSITTVAQPIYQLGEAAMAAILDPETANPQGMTPGRRIWLKASLVVRQSTGPCRESPAIKRKTATLRNTTPREERHDHEDHET
jgi:DNA-binding LacI/PurR family transcriptional regulator